MIIFLLTGLACAAGIYFSVRPDILGQTPSIVAAMAAAAVAALIASSLVTKISLEPFRVLRQAIVHVYPEGEGSPPPDLEKLRIGRELVTVLANQVYQLASQEANKEIVAYRRQMNQSANVVSHLPLPLFVFNKQLLVTFTSDVALEYIGAESTKVYGKQLFENLNLEFNSERTLEQWIKECQDNKAIDISNWENVRVRLPDGRTRRCDLSAYYNRGNLSGTEYIVTFFDKTEYYDREDRSVDFVAMAVHELRMPLTVMRGYIEVFEEELADNLSSELKGFLSKLKISANQLSVFTNNILNVARIDNNQLTLELHEEQWTDVLKHIVEDNLLKARVHGIDIKLEIADNIPAAAVDRISIYEVVTNLLDNAIKYSPKGQTITVQTRLNEEGMIETTVEDSGPGIPSNLMDHLFEKFSRSHRTSRKVSGSGLGLYLCQSIVNAHGGQIWVKSKEGEGSTFGFSLQPFSSVKSESEDGGQSVTRSAHGWIKNHSLYRR